MTLDDIQNKINASNSIIILTHKDPDGDAIGTSLALYGALKSLNKNVDVIIPIYPECYGFLPFIDEIKKESEISSYDLAIAVDCATLERLNGFSSYFENAKDTISIDHHGTNTMFANCNFVNPESPAASQVLFSIFQFLNIELTKEIATCLYTGILTDTGGFKYSGVTEETFEISRDLMKYGVNISEVAKKTLDTMTPKQLDILKRCLNRMELFEDGKIALTYATKEDIEELEAQNGDFEGIVNYGRNIENVEISIFLKESEEGFKASLRSNYYANVSDIALMFNGGGHPRAAGCLIKDTLENAKVAIINEAKRYLK